MLRPLKLCRERLGRILHILDKHNGLLPVWEFSRTFSVWEWEVQQAAELGWVRIETRKPRTGRPSRVVTRALDVSKIHTAKLPPFRNALPKTISIRHWWFAHRSIWDHFS